MRLVGYLLLLASVSACCWGGLGVPGDEPPLEEALVSRAIPSTIVVSSDPWDHPVHGISEASYRLERSHLPQRADLAARYRDAAPSTVSPFSGLLLCRVLMAPGSGRDLFGGPELYLRLTAGERTVQTGEGAGDGYFSLPVHGLAAGEAMTITVLDRDVIFDDGMGEGTTTFEGTLPFDLSFEGGGTGEIGCRAEDPEYVEREATRSRDAVDHALALLGAPTASLTDPELGWPMDAARAVHVAMRELLALRGFDHPEVVSRMAAAEGVSAASSAALASAVNERRASAATTDVSIPFATGLEGIVSVGCDSSAIPEEIRWRFADSPCHITLTLTATSPHDLSWVGAGESAVRWISSSGHTALPTFGCVTGGAAPTCSPLGPTLAAGSSATLWWSAPEITEGVLVFTVVRGASPIFVRH